LNYRFLKFVIITAFVFFIAITPQVHGFPAPYGGCTATDRTLFLNEPPLTGDDVLELQERLSELGYYNGKLSGVFDEKTCEAVKKIQKDSNMNPTGEVGPATWEILSKGIEAPPVTTNTSKKEKPEGYMSILIDTNKKTLTLLCDGEPFKTFPCAVGKFSTPSPIGEWTIVHKGGKWGGGFGDRWMGLNVPWGVYGIHGTNKPYSIGTNASHGCIRMFNEHVRDLYQYVEIGTPVKIVGDPAMPPGAKYRKSMRKDATGPDVVQVQLRLKEKGFLCGRADGRFGTATELAVKFFQVRSGLKDTGIVEEETYSALGIEL
jgi:L,D-transpeptidase ErfK/SrfK